MYQRILVPIDGSPTSNAALDEAMRLARLTGGRLRLFHLVDAMKFANGFETGAVYVSDVLPLLREDGRRLIDEASARVAAAGVIVDAALPEVFAGPLAELVVAEEARWEADLIVIGTHGRRGIGRLVLGSDAEQILRLARVPVLLVRSTGGP